MFHKRLLSSPKLAIALLILISNGLPVITASAALSSPQSTDTEPLFTLTKPLQEPIKMSPSTPSAIAQNPALTAEMDDYLQAHYETGRFMGAAIVVRGEETIFAAGYGMASLEHQVPNAHSTKFRIGSITKQFTATAILQLQDRGLLSVQAPVATYLPDYPNGERLTLHH
ncbi:MAG: serine hydrolase domain-containing protein, partial [Cyanobacteria bacterium P01_C01_bin.120]